MNYEQQNNSALKAYYKNERLPALTQQIEELAVAITDQNANELQALITEFNQGLVFVYGEDAAYRPHYKLVSSENKIFLRQYLPAFEKTLPKKDAQRFNDGAAAGMLKPSIQKVASYENAPDFDLSFLDKPLIQLATDIDQEVAGEDTDRNWEDEIVIFDQDHPDQGHTTTSLAEQELEEDDYEDYIEDDEYDGYIVDDFPPEVTIYFDENVEAGMLMLELYNPISDEIDVLYVPHIPMNFPVIMSIISDYMEVGGGVNLLFSMEDKNNNLILPSSPADPDTPIDPLLN